MWKKWQITENDDANIRQILWQHKQQRATTTAMERTTQGHAKPDAFSTVSTVVSTG